MSLVRRVKEKVRPMVPLAVTGILLSCLIPLRAAEAHKVTIFAWVEGETVHTLSKFSGGKRVHEGKVIVYDTQGDQLFEGKTDDHGEFSFKIPKRTGLKVVLQAGMGHRAEWTIPREEMGLKPVESTGNTRARKPAGEEPKGNTQTNNLSPLAAEEIQMAVERALDKKLKPVIQMLAESQQTGPSFGDILGGIGYILGLMGIASYFHYRRKRSDTTSA